MAWSVGIVFLLPDVPMTARFLSKEDRVKAVVRVKENMTGIKSDQFQWSQCREALLDTKTWFLVLIQICANIPNGGLHSVSIVPGLHPPRKKEPLILTTLLLDIVQRYHRGRRPWLPYVANPPPHERVIPRPALFRPSLHCWQHVPSQHSDLLDGLEHGCLYRRLLYDPPDPARAEVGALRGFLPHHGFRRQLPAYNVHGVG